MPERDKTYFLAQAESLSSKSLSVFHAPITEGFVIPVEVLKVSSVTQVKAGSLYRLVTGQHRFFEFEKGFEPSTIEKIVEAFKTFINTESAGMVEIKGDAPDEIRTIYNEMRDGSKKQNTEVPEEDDRPYPGLYL